MYNHPLIDDPGQLHFLIGRFVLKLGSFSSVLWGLSGIFYVGLLVFLAVANLYNKTPSNSRLRRLFYSPFFFAILIGLGISLLRLPNLALPEQNPDESFWISGAAALIKDFRIWMSVDTTTSGPLVIFPLTIINSLGSSLNHATVRLFGLLCCVIPAVLFIYSAFISFFGDKIARIAILPLAVSLAFIQSADFIAYNGEHVPMMLTAAAVFLYSKTISMPQKKLIYLSLLGFVLGLVPYAKLQAVPITLAISVFVIVMIIAENRRNLKHLSKLSSAFIVSGLIPSLVVLCYLLLFNVFGDFWQSYILNNLAYARKGIMANEEMSLACAVLELPNSITALPDLRYYFEFSGIIFLSTPFILAAFRKYISYERYKITILSFLCVMAGIYGVVKPLKVFGHYLILLIIPAAFLTGAILDTVFRIRLRSRTAFSTRSIKILFAVAILSYVIFPALYMVSSASKGISYVTAALPDIRYYFEFSGLFFLSTPFMLVVLRKHISSDKCKAVILSVLCVIAGIYGVFEHRNILLACLILLIIPAVFITGISLGIVPRMRMRRWAALSIRSVKIIFAVVIWSYVIFPAVCMISSGSKGISYIKSYGVGVEKSDIAAKISAYALPNERMAVWGWGTKYYIETGLIQAARDACSFYQIKRNPQQDYYLKRYLSDIIRNKPIIFLDTASPKQFAFNDRNTQGHEQFPIIKPFVDKNYTLVSEIDGVRIYVLNERLKELSLRS